MLPQTKLHFPSCLLMKKKISNRKRNYENINFSRICVRPNFNIIIIIVIFTFCCCFCFCFVGFLHGFCIGSFTMCDVCFVYKIHKMDCFIILFFHSVYLTFSCIFTVVRCHEHNENKKKK